MALLEKFAPFDTGAGSGVMADTWRDMMRHLRESGVIAWHVAPAEPNELQVYADSTGMQVKVRPGECWVLAHWAASTAEKILTIEPAHATENRADRVVVRADLVAETVDLVVLTGTPGDASPDTGYQLQLPSLTQDGTVWEIPLAYLFVDAGVTTITADNIVDERKRVGSGVFNTWTPLLYAEAEPGSGGTYPVDLGVGGVKRCDYLQMGKMLVVRYYFGWGDPPYDGGSGPIYTELPPWYVAADGGDTHLTTHLWTTDAGNWDWPGTTRVTGGENTLWPYFPYSETQMDIGKYTINDYYSPGPGSGVPSIPNGYPQGGHLTISGVVEVA